MMFVFDIGTGFEIRFGLRLGFVQNFMIRLIMLGLKLELVQELGFN